MAKASEDSADKCVLGTCREPALVCRQHFDDARAEAARAEWVLRGEGEGPGVAVHFSHFEAAMVLCVLAVAKGGPSRFDAEDLPLRREALERAYAKLGARLGAGDRQSARQGAKAGVAQ